MKKILGLTCFLVFILSCSLHKQATYILPDAMLPEVKVGYAKRCEQGQVLYSLNCAGCHNTKSGRRELIPDFNADQLRGYALRVSNAKHEENMPDSLVSEEELAIIMTFLTYKVKNKK